MAVADVRYCMLNQCQNDGTCEETETGFTCHCLEGFVGENCQGETAWEALGLGERAWEVGSGTNGVTRDLGRTRDEGTWGRRTGTNCEWVNCDGLEIWDL